jgi:hypothetical protein
MDCAKQETNWNILCKYGSKVLIGKRKIEFPINIPLMYSRCSHLKTLIESTDIETSGDFSQVTFLGDYDIDYDTVAFMDIWKYLNLPDTTITSILFRKPKTTRVPYILDIRLYACYFGIPVVDNIDEELSFLYRATNISNTDKSSIKHIVKEYELAEFKKDFLKIIKNFKNESCDTIFKKYRTIFEPIDSHFLEITESILPEFKQLFYDMVVECVAPLSRNNFIILSWLDDHKDLKQLPRSYQTYSSDLWKI